MRKLAAALSIYAWLASAALAQYMGPVPVTTATIALPTATQARTKLIAGISGKSTYITGFHISPVATAVITWSAGTGTNCGTNTTVLDGPDTYPSGTLADSYGVGQGAVLVAPQGYDVCLTITTAAIAGSVAYGQF